LRKRGEQPVRQPEEAQLVSQLQTRLDWLIRSTLGDQQDSPHSTSTKTVPDAIIQVGRKLARAGWVAYLVGGTLRDLLVEPEGHRRVHPRDIDIIVDGVTREELQEVLQEPLVLERFTRFGGLHLSRPLSSGSRVLFDIWTLSDTWGFHSQKIAPRIENFPGTTFLNIDSCATQLMQPHGKQRTFFEKGFFEGIGNRMLDVNYAPNPYPYVCVARALVLAAQLDFTISRPLAEFILQHMAGGGLDNLIDAQRSHYGTVRCGAKELELWLHEIRLQFDSGLSVLRMEVSRARRAELWSDYPAANMGSHQMIPS
jgi:hypothetical protein